MESIKEFLQSEEKVQQLVDTIEYDLLTKTKIPFGLTAQWRKNFPQLPGVYAIFENGKFVYVGETADLRDRMKDLRRTYNHTFRNKIGILRLNGVRHGNLFTAGIETELDNYMQQHLAITYHSILLGRKEVEARIVEKYKDMLINSSSVRGLNTNKK